MSWFRLFPRSRPRDEVHQWFIWDLFLDDARGVWKGRQEREGSVTQPANPHGEPQLRSAAELRGIVKWTIPQRYPD